MAIRRNGGTRSHVEKWFVTTSQSGVPFLRRWPARAGSHLSGLVLDAFLRNRHQYREGIIGTSAIISAISALMFGVFDDNLYRYRIGRRFGRRHLMLMLIAPSLLIGVLLDSRIASAAVRVRLRAMGGAGPGFSGVLQPVAWRNDEGFQPADEVVDHQNVHFHFCHHFHTTRRKLGVVDIR